MLGLLWLGDECEATKGLGGRGGHAVRVLISFKHLAFLSKFEEEFANHGRGVLRILHRLCID